MTWIRPVLWGFVVLAATMWTGCGGGGAKQQCMGTEACACYPNGTCNSGLSCFSDLCVNANGSGGAAGATGAAGSVAAAGANGTAGAVGAAGSSGVAGAAGKTAPGGTGGGTCRVFEDRPDATAPTVFVLVDRSGSMFHCLGQSSIGNCTDLSDTPWAKLKTGVLDVVSSLQGQIRFGFGAFTGETTGTCPMFDKVDPAIDNGTAITTLYNALQPPTKGETPTARVLATVRGLLAADTTPGQKYILFVTDGEPDYCGDGNGLCAVDGVVAQLQTLKGAGITTFVFGLQAPGISTVSSATLQAFANAGAGQPVAAPIDPPSYIYSQCSSGSSDPNVIGWKQDYAAAGRTGATPLGSYSSNGTAPVYMPDPTNQQALTNLLATAVAGVKSCNFDLANGLRVDQSRIAEAKVLIQGQEIARDGGNGWSMASDTRLVLSGSACTLWRMPDVRTIDFQFPCGVVTGN
jgi:hypothetical protein